MIEQPLYRVNAPKVVSETIDGEVIIIHLEAGIYYSLLGSSAVIWSAIEKGATLDDINNALRALYAVNVEDITNDVSAFLQHLIDERLIVPVTEIDHHAPPAMAPEASDMMRSADRPAFDTPTLTRYTDMQDLLLLDPIHEVDDTGWPMAPHPGEQAR